jgi:hypothetical protein
MQTAVATWTLAFAEKDPLTLAIAIGGVLISIVTLYLTVLRPAQLQVFIGDLLLVRTTFDNRVLIAPELAIHNNGAKTSAIFKITGRFSSNDVDRETRLVWKAVWQATNTAEPRAPVNLFWTYAGPPATIVVPKGETVVTRLMFTSEGEFELRPGRYEVVFDASSGARERDIFSVKRVLWVTERDVQWLVEHKPVDHMGKNLQFVFDFKAGQYVHA